MIQQNIHAYIAVTAQFFFDIQIEGPHADDNTDLNAIEIICESREGVECGKTASSGQQKWGDWTCDALCPVNTFLTSFSFQVQKNNVSRYNFKL